MDIAKPKSVPTPVRARAAKLLEEVIDQIAKEEGLTNRKIDCVLQAVFGQIADDIRSGQLKGSHVLYLGKFMVKPYNIVKHHNDNSLNQDGSNTENKG